MASFDEVWGNRGVVDERAEHAMEHFLPEACLLPSQWADMRRRVRAGAPELELWLEVFEDAVVCLFSQKTATCWRKAQAEAQRWFTDYMDPAVGSLRFIAELMSTDAERISRRALAMLAAGELPISRPRESVLAVITSRVTNRSDYLDDHRTRSRRYYHEHKPPSVASVHRKLRDHG